RPPVSGRDGFDAAQMDGSATRAGPRRVHHQDIAEAPSQRGRSLEAGSRARHGSARVFGTAGFAPEEGHGLSRQRIQSLKHQREEEGGPMPEPGPDRALLQGKRVAFTGRLASMTRAEAADLVRAHGGRFTTTLNRFTSLLVVGQDGWPFEKDGRLSG